MAESFILSIAQGVIQKLASEALKEIGLAWGVNKELEKLESTLNYIKAVLMDAELQQSQSQSHELQLWIKSLRHACYSINDVMAEFEYRALQKRLLQQNFTRKVRLFFSSSNPIMFRHRIGHRMKQINETLDKIAADRNKFHLREGEENRQVIPRESSSAGTYASLGNLKVFGREVEKETIVNLLLANSGEHQALDVVSIVGMGGTGKTTLAKMVYNDERLTKHFDLKGWVCVSEDFNVSSLLKKIMKDLTGTPCDDWDNGQVVSQLQLVLRGRRFLLVLDDVWNENRSRWVELTSLLVGANGGRVLVTTRSYSIASMVGTFPVQKLLTIPDKDGMNLFASWAFKEGEDLEKENLNLWRIGEEIVSKCKGVPLAIRTLGSLLYLKRDERDWVSVRDDEIWRIDQVEGGILPALRLSYDRLPSHLKQCFAHFSAYPKDYTIHSSNLVAVWIALGFVQSTSQTEELEEIGTRYIQQLHSRSFFEEFYDLGTHFLLSVHDLMIDLALLVAENEYATVDIHAKTVDKETRYLTFNNNDPFPQGNPPGWLPKLKSVRSVKGQLYMGKPVYESFVDLFISKFKYLRLLDLSYSVCVSLPSNIGDLKHLRHLYLRRSRNLKFLPDSICKLLYVEVLTLSGCIELRKLPKGFGNLVSLRVLSITTQLQCFPARVFQGLVSLRMLSISQCNNLEYLFDDGSEMWMQRSLVNLRWMVISRCGNLVSLPRGLRYLHALQILKIESCEKLDLNKSDSDGGHDTIPDIDATGLMSLRFLFINGLPKLVDLPQWLIQTAADTLNVLALIDCINLASFPECLKALRKLHISNCPKLTILPEGVSCCGMLKELIIEYCPELIRRCQRDTGEDWGKISSVPDIVLNLDGVRSSVGNQSSGEKRWYESKAFLRTARQH